MRDSRIVAEQWFAGSIAARAEIDIVVLDTSLGNSMVSEAAYHRHEIPTGQITPRRRA